MIDRSARQVRRQFPDAVLSVGHLSRRGGGEIDRHASHESGRDADIGFYIVNDQKKQVMEPHFVAFGADGKAKTWPGAHFDDARNWALVASFLSDPSAHVSHIFVAAPLKARLMAYAEKMGAPLPLRIRASETLAQPHGSLPHDDHFHVRISCPPHMPKCIELPVRQVAKATRKTESEHDAHVKVADAHHATHDHAAAKKADSHAAHGEHARTDDDDDADEKASTARATADEAPIPRLTPEVPGLDAAVIGAPLRPNAPKPETQSPPPPAASEPHSAPIDDVDGVLEP